jgi:protein farnesyltransferase/geranylgeranyltransferase type-1 subunit alpha
MGKYEGNPVWEDVAPLPQDDLVPRPLASIAYPDQYVEATSYLRAIMAVNEMSPRVLELMADIIDMNPAHYTVWYVRPISSGNLRLQLSGYIEHKLYERSNLTSVPN